ncbi:uncharacterized protein LOC109841335 [Asparagus officinalis]|uniref:uncharacterized protein LOC109841335 n=1 Tax=Asparagus officinalis TaxID=4686 RepID=UPI00098DFF13|nr:uncharacterized protein LOC109841335 [Asparagus officinalis]
MSNKGKRQAPSVPVVSTGCSTKLKSFLCTCNRAPQQKEEREEEKVASFSTPLLPHSSNRGSSSIYQDYSKKIRQLEMELGQMKMALSIKNQPKENHKKTSTRKEMIKLADGSYLHQIKKIDSPWKRLLMQVSTPMIIENGSTASQVIRAMASMGMEDLYDCLTESMPMGDLRHSDLSKMQKRIVTQGSEDGFVEAVLLGATEELEVLAMEGLRIQMSSTRKGSVNMRNNERARNKEPVVLAMLVQVRDPEERYESVGELMIALVEVSDVEKGERKYHSEGVHVAGIKCVTVTNGEEYYMWSASAEGCSRMRNTDIAITL